MQKKISEKDVPSEILSEQSVNLLKELHLLTREGHLNADARRKLKQINHFAGFIRPGFADIAGRHGEPVLVDVASGNSYLGFILYDLFFKNRGQGKILAIEENPELMERSQKRASHLGFSRMEFQCAAIREAILPDRVHMLTALHACDQATDEALVMAIQNHIDYVFLVPCCQAEMARLLKKNSKLKIAHLLFSYPHHRREFGSHLTNVLRVLALKSFGYQVTVTELTTWEHTAKGELIMAKKVQGFDEKARKEFFDLLEFFEVSPQLAQDLNTLVN
jgi:hypothetical protein